MKEARDGGNCGGRGWGEVGAGGEVEGKKSYVMVKRYHNFRFNAEVESLVSNTAIFIKMKLNIQL